jgi:flagellar biosynthesis/type III secretory pathway M-ring protein FliF/YscJ
MRFAMTLFAIAVMSAFSAVGEFATRQVSAFQAPIASIPSTPGLPMTGGEIDLVKWAVTQGGLTLVVIILVFILKRELARKTEKTQEELGREVEAKQLLANVLEKNANAMLQQALAVAANTKATEQLALNVNHLADRRGGRP